MSDACATAKRPAPAPTECHFWLTRRTRYCSAPPLPNSNLCRFHDETGSKVTCSDCNIRLDAERLGAHEKKCPQRLLKAAMAREACYCENFNAGESSASDATSGAAAASDASDELAAPGADANSSSKSGVGLLDVSVFMQLKARIDRAFAALPAEATNDCVSEVADGEHEFVRTDANANVKHERQQAAIMGHLRALGVLHADRIFVEMGAGKAGLLGMVRNHVDAECVALDNQAFRFAADGHVRGTAPFHRIRVDLLHANLARVEQLHATHAGAHRHAVAVGKHVCGAATDFSLRALRVLQPAAHCTISASPAPADSSSSSSSSPLLACVDAIAIATCCHHRCEWRHLVNAAFLERLGLSASDFRWMCAVSSWCVSEIAAPQPSRDQRRAASSSSSFSSSSSSDAMETATSNEPASADASSASSSAAVAAAAAADTSRSTSNSTATAAASTAADTGEHTAPSGADADALRATGTRLSAVLSPAERTHLGWRCKRLIDWSRVEYLRARGWRAHLVTYVQRAVTKENTLLLAVSPRPSGAVAADETTR